MASDVKWIKITTDIFDDEKILLIESLPDSYAIITVWFKLLCLAGKQNNSGVFMMGQIAYTDKMLATIFRMKETTVTMALQTFEQFGMVEIIDGVITIPNWGKHQNLDQLENRKEFMRNYMREYREKQKALTCKPNCKHNSKPNVRQADKEEDKELEEELRIKNKKDNIDYQQIKDLFNSLCPSFPSIKTLSDSRKKAIKARLNNYSVEDFKTLFGKAEASDFLKGSNDRNWTATFDWLIKDANMAKVLEGNYDNKAKSGRKEVVPGWMNKPKYAANNPFLQHKQNDTDYGALEAELIENGVKTAGNNEDVRRRAEQLKEQLQGM
jgi:predicted phage replisome organizer